MHFVVGKDLAELLLINGSELLDGLAAQLVWCFHAAILSPGDIQTETAELAKSGKSKNAVPLKT
jgi:hypothetical protein